MTARRGFSQVLANRNFLILLATQCAGDLGSGLATIVITWYVLERGGPVLLGFLAVAQALPYLFFAALAGALCDRVDLRRMVVTGEGLSAVLAVAAPLLAWAGWLGPWTAIALCLGITMLRDFASMARRSLVPRILPAEGFLAANSSTNLIFRLASVASGVLVGPLSHALGLINLLWLTGAGLVADSLGFLALKLPRPAAPGRTREPLGRLVRRAGGDVLEGFKIARHNAYLRGILMMDGMFFTLGYGLMMVAAPTLVKTRLAGDAGALGLLQASGSTAALVGAVLVGQFLGHSRRGRVLCAAWVGYGCASVALGFAPTLPVAMAIAAIQQGTGFCIPILGQTIIQEKVPSAQLGRAFGAWDTVAPGFGIGSAALAGLMARALPVQALYGALGAIALGNALLVRRCALWGVDGPVTAPRTPRGSSP